MKYIILCLCLCNFLVHSQVSYPPLYIDNSQPWTSGTINISNVDNIIYYNSTSNNANIDLKASKEILLQPNAITANFSPLGSFHASISPELLEIVSFHPNGWNNIAKYDKFEMGLKLPPIIQTQIDAFLNGQPGLNPYDPTQIQIECTFNNGAFKRYGFYYRDYMVQNNEWIEKPNNYKFRIRVAPPQVGSNVVVAKLIVNGAIIETITRYFEVNNSGNPGHLEMATGNLRKLQFNNGSLFYALGQNIGYAIPSQESNCSSGECVTPNSFNKQRGYIQDLAANKGNFVRLRLDVLNGLAEWPYKKQTINDPPVPNKPLSSYLNNYDDNQRYLWEMDKTFSIMEGADLYCMLNLFPDQNFSLDGAYDCGHSITWSNNPYNTITGNDLAGCKAFYTNTQSKDTYRKWLYYIMARYGYSTRLGIWEIINETSGVANSYAWFNNCTSGNYAMYSPYNNEPTFADEVNNWTCDMKSYLEQFYPWHPTTTGNTSESNLPYANCLNIWSTNDYVGYIQLDQGQPDHNKYSDANKGRFLKSKFFENNSRPFIFGELGLGDGMNFVDKYNDRTFHNTLWSTSMMGGIGSGLYWNDWTQAGGINHRRNFQAIKTFFTNYTNLNQSLVSQYATDHGVGSLNDRYIHTYCMKNPNNEYIIGWAQNNSSNWTVDYTSIPTVYNTDGSVQASPALALSESQFNGVIDQYSCFSTNQNPYIKIDALKALKRYKVKIYDAYNNADLLETKQVITTIAGALIFRRSMPNSINIGSDFNPDYAFIAEYDPIFSFRQSNTNQEADTMYIDDINTLLCLEPDFIKDGIINDYNYNWNFGNGVTSTSITPCTNYTEEGAYIIEVTAVNEKKDSTVNFSKKLVVIKKSLLYGLDITAFPNPATNKLFLSFDKTLLINPKIKLIDVLGKENEVLLNDDNSIDIDRFVTGIYLIKFTTKNYEKIIKISIQH